jgi:hypothetical protein
MIGTSIRGKKGRNKPLLFFAPASQINRFKTLSSEVDTSGAALAQKARRLLQPKPRRIGMTSPKLTIRPFPPIDWAGRREYAANVVTSV